MFARSSGATLDTAIVPRKSEIPVDTLRSILNQAHIAPEEWDKLADRSLNLPGAALPAPPAAQLLPAAPRTARCTLVTPG